MLLGQCCICTALIIIDNRLPRGNTKKYLTNGHGDVIALAGMDGVVSKWYSYDAFGIEQSYSANDTNPFRYCGEYTDAETGSVYLRARYYMPGIGRFSTEDPIKDGLNWYVYCGNNAVNRIDPSGLADYVVVLAAGINTDAHSDYFFWLKNEIQYRMNSQGDNVRFIEVYPYGEGGSTSTVAQGSTVMSDTEPDSHKGGDHVNWKLTEANVQEHEKIIMIGHSGGGVAVIDAHGTMDEYHKSKVVQVVTIGSPGSPVHKGNGSKTTVITDPNDPVPNLSSSTGAKHHVTVDNGVSAPSYTSLLPVDSRFLAIRMANGIVNINIASNNAKLYADYKVKVHVSYFDSAQKAANILNAFWGRAME